MSSACLAHASFAWLWVAAALTLGMRSLGTYRLVLVTSVGAASLWISKSRFESSVPSHSPQIRIAGYLVPPGRPSVH